MRIVIVNHCHPDTPHVCARRAATFAEVLAGQGHRVVLATETLNRDDPAPAPDAVRKALLAHDWSRVFRLAGAPRGAPFSRAARAGRLPPGFRQAVIAGVMVGQGGMFADWRRGAAPYWPVLAEALGPDITWGIFGNTDAWQIARGIARAAGCPWVMDIKDYWRSFIPAPLRTVLARRFRDAAALTCLSETNREEAAPWFGDGTVVYSGLPAVPLPDRVGPTADGDLRLTLSGALYGGEDLALLAEGLRHWLENRSETERARLIVTYAGAEAEKARAALAGLQPLCRVDLQGFLPLDRLLALQATSLANLYIASARTFHSKVLDLFLAGRPVIAVPGENDEPLRLAHRVGARLIPCAGVSAIGGALDDVWSRRHDPRPLVDRDALAAFSRERQAERLVAVFRRAAGG